MRTKGGLMDPGTVEGVVGAMVGCSEEGRFGYDGIRHRILAPSCPAHGKTPSCPAHAHGKTHGISARGGKIPVKSQGDSSGGKVPVNSRRDSSHVMDAQIPTDDDIPMEDGDSHGGRRYPEDKDARMTRCHRVDREHLKSDTSDLTLEGGDVVYASAGCIPSCLAFDIRNYVSRISFLPFGVPVESRPFYSLSSPHTQDLIQPPVSCSGYTPLATPVQIFSAGKEGGGTLDRGEETDRGARPSGGKKAWLCSSGEGLQEDAAGAAGDEDQRRPHGIRSSQMDRWADWWKAAKRIALRSRWTSDPDAKLPRPWQDLQGLRTDQPLRQGLQESGEFCERREDPGQEPRRLLWREGLGQ